MSTVTRAAPFLNISGDVFDTRAYGGLGLSSTADARPVVQAAVDAAIAAIAVSGLPATVQLQPGTLSFTTGVTLAATSTDSAFSACGVRLPVGLAALLTIRCATPGATTIKLSDACRNAFVINKTADYQTFRNVTTENFDVDNNSAVGRCHVLIGNMPAFGTRQNRLNYANLTHRRHRILNVPVDLTATTSQKTAVCYVGQHVNSGQDGTLATQLTMEATQTSSLDITVEDMVQYGGHNMVVVASWLRAASYQSTGPTNHFYDRIHFRRCSHLLAAVPATTASQTSFYMGGSGIGEHGTIVDCYSENIADDAIELGGMQDVVIDRFRCKDPFLIGILLRNSQPLRDVDSQRVVIRDLHVQVTAALMSGTTTPYGVPFRVLLDNGATAGTVILDNPVYESAGQTYSATGRNHLFLEVVNAVQRVVVRNPLITISGYTYDSTTTVDMALIYIAPTVADFTVVELHGVDVRIVGTGFTQTGTGSLAFHVVQVEGTRPRVSLNGLDSDLSGLVFNAVGGATSQLTVGKGTTANTRVVARGIRPRASANSLGGRIGVRLYSAGLVEQLVVEDCNFGSSTGLSLDVDLANASTNAPNVQLRGNVYRATSAAVALTVGTSPYAYQNLTGRLQQIRVSGGTVSLIEWGDTAPAYTTTGLTAGLFLVGPGQYLRTTYSVAPTMTALPVSG